MAIRIGPTEAQVVALGLLMINKKVWVSYEISPQELFELEEMGLCHGHVVKEGIPPIRWDISSKLLKQWEPYIVLSANWHNMKEYLDKMQSRIHPYYRAGTVYHKPPDLDEAEQMDLMKASQSASEFMMEMVKQCGRGLALHWERWKYETQPVTERGRETNGGEEHG